MKLGEVDELLKEIAAEGTADAAILEGDDLFIRLGESVCLLDEGRIDVDAGWSIQR